MGRIVAICAALLCLSTGAALARHHRVIVHPFLQAQQRATIYWQQRGYHPETTCGGHIAFGVQSFPPRPDGTVIDAESTSRRPDSNPADFYDCHIIINGPYWSHRLDSQWSQFCTVWAHELGLLTTGVDENTAPNGDILNPYGPANPLAICQKPPIRR